MDFSHMRYFLSRALASSFCFLLLESSFLQGSDLFQDLLLVEEIDREAKDRLPFFYNFSLVGGYFNMPSARTPQEGVIALGAARAHPYDIYGLAFQYFDRIEFSLNYRIFTGMLEENFGSEGFGDDAERIGNGKFIFNLPSDTPGAPSFAIGADDFIGTKRFNSQYMVMTQQWNAVNLEVTLGWGRRRIKGFFGGFAWTPWRKCGIPVLSQLSLVAEYDAIDYKNHGPEHPEGRDVKSRVNAGVSFVWGDLFQLTVSSLRGGHLGASGSLRYPLGSSEGLLKKSDNPLLYATPVDTEPLGVVRPKYAFAQELAYVLAEQGLDLYRVELIENHRLWLKIVNNSYREERIVRERIERVLAALLPSDIESVDVLIEADALSCQSYRFRKEDLYRFRQGVASDFEMQTVAPMRESIAMPIGGESLLKRAKNVWSFTFRPRLLTFFGSAQGKVKYNLGLLAIPEGYLFDTIYYQAQVAYEVKSSMANLGAVDRLNPSNLPNVRTDTVKYFQTGTVALETGFLQKGWNLGKGWFYRLAGGYFEPAYGGVATEFLYYPVESNWAFGLSEATVMKREYTGLRFTGKVRQMKHGELTHQKFIGVQYFASLYYFLKPWNVDLKVMGGQFLAKDRGVRFEMSRWFQSGVNVTLWYTMTNGSDRMHGYKYYDKGFAFAVPLDFFLKKSSRSYMGYAMSAWLRDVGAIAETGRQLYTTLNLERQAP